MKDRQYIFDQRAYFDAKYPGLEDLRQMLRRAAEEYGDAPKIHEKIDGKTVSYSKARLLRDSEALGTALMRHGFGGMTAALVAENSYRWVVSYFAVVNGIGIMAPLDKENRGAALAMLINKAHSGIVFYDKAHAKDIDDVRDLCPGVRAWIQISPDTEAREGDLTVDALLAEGYTAVTAGDREYIDAPIDPEAPAVIHFTSGTTGANKGVVLCHRNICANVTEERKVVPSEVVQMSVLPLNHAYECNCGLMGRIYGDVEYFINDSIRNILPNMKEFKPGSMTVVPLFLDLIAGGIRRAIRKRGDEARFARLALLSNQLLAEGIDARAQIFAEYRAVVDENLSLLVCGGAPLNPEVVRFLNTVGVDVCNGYGITECSPLVSLNTDCEHDPASVGKPMSADEIRIDDPDADGIGEILVRGPNVMLGYYEDEAANAEVFTEDGFFRTGDFGYLSANGEIYISGRKKNIIILDNGKNVHPEEIETEVQQKAQYITEMVAYQRDEENSKGGNMIAAVLHIDRDNYFPGVPEEKIIEKALSDVREANAALAGYKRIGAIQITYAPLPQTTTRKVRRADTVERFRGEKLYFLH